MLLCISSFSTPGGVSNGNDDANGNGGGGGGGGGSSELSSGGLYLDGIGDHGDGICMNDANVNDACSCGGMVVNVVVTVVKWKMKMKISKNYTRGL